MSPADDTPRGRAVVRHRRILVAFDPAALPAAALDAPARLASALGAELVALFVERQELIDLAGFPRVRAFSLDTADHLALDMAEMTRALRAQAQRAERLLADLAARHRVAARLQVARGEVVAEIIAAAQGCDLVVVGRGRRGPRALGGTVRDILSGVACAVLVLPEGTTAVRRVVLIDDGRDGIHARAEEIARGLHMALLSIPAGDARAIAALDRLPGTLVITARDPRPGTTTLDERLAALDQPLLVLE
jgi:nucleotide-binding universal stress UspA family protein